MKRINLLIVFFVVAVAMFLGFNFKLTKEVIVFYGFANNKELIVNLENAALVKEIYVKPGQSVIEGQDLLEVSRSIIAVTQSDINHDISNLKSQFQIWESGLKNSIRSIKAQKYERKNQLQSAIHKLESEMEINKSLIKDIASIDQIKDEQGNNPSSIELEGLKSELTLSMQTYDTQIKKLENELSNPSNPLLIEINKLSDNLDFVNEEEKNLTITAPNTGIVGTILCKVGENIPSFTPYLTIYEEAPNHVKGYVLESLLLAINKGDSITVQSVSHSNTSVEGVVIGMGSRIVEIPSRLTKNPNFPSYGREIEIKIPSKNPFLQNEKVILKKKDNILKLEMKEIASLKSKS
jgi:multidrug resistance efflux pump